MAKITGHEGLTFEGTAKCYKGEEAAMKAIMDGSVDKGDVVVVRYEGPKGGPGMPEAGLIPIPRKLAKEGVKDMVRLSDGRMSGTAAGTIILHVCPEAAAGGTLDIVQSGDIIILDVKQRLLEL